MASCKNQPSASLPVIAVLIAGLSTAALGVNFAGGTGTISDPFRISTARQLLDIGSNPAFLNQCFVLTNDIDFDDHYGPDGHLTRAVIAAAEQGPGFEGWLDGGGYVIRHLRISATYGDYFGLVGRVGPKGTILSLRLEDSTIEVEGDNVGLLAGFSSGTIIACSAQGQVEGDANVGLLIGTQEGGMVAYGSCEGTMKARLRSGGLVGQAVEAEIFGCSSDCRLESTDKQLDDCGGLVGWVTRGTVEDSFARVDLVCPQSSGLGGLVAYNDGGMIRGCLSLGRIVGKYSAAGLVGANTGTIRSCYSLCQVESGRSAGGLVCSNQGTVMLCYAAGSVTAPSAGGLIGQGNGAFLSYWDIDKSGIHTSAGGFGRTTRQMQQAITFKGWGHEGEWVLPEGDTPRLWWEPHWGVPLFDEPTGFSAGSGTKEDPFQIQTAAEFASLAWDAGLLDKHFVLMQDVDLADVGPNMVLPVGTMGLPFCGSLDGQGHTVSGLSADLSANYVGLFGCVGTSADGPNRVGSVVNLSLREAQIVGGEIVGALTACLDGGRIERCFVTGQVRGAATVGGAVGEVVRGEVLESAFEGYVSGHHRIGGLVGTHQGVLRSCYSDGQVVGDGENAFGIGGLVGDLDTPSIEPCWPLIAFCYSQAEVKGSSGVGGLIGSARGGEVFACYATGRVEGHVETTTGGLAGSKRGTVTWRNFWDRDSSGIDTSAFGESKITPAMMYAPTYTGWAYGQQWTLEADTDYPRLVWEDRAGPPMVDPERAYGGGSGTWSDPYLIANTVHLVILSRHPQDFSRHFRLVRDIDLKDTPVSPSPIGTLMVPFTGSFDGNYHTLKNLRLLDDKASYAGLFRSVQRSAASGGMLSGVISNLHLEDAHVTAEQFAAVLAAHNEGEILFCTASGCTTAAEDYAGMLVAHNGMNGELLACASAGTVLLGGLAQQEGHFQHAGGLVALNEGILMLCSSSGQVRGSRDVSPSVKPRRISEDIGGLVGTNQGGTITGCTSTSRVVGFETVGGLVGNNRGGWLYRCGATADVDAANDAGGLVAQSTGGTMVGCFSRSEVAGSNAGGVICFAEDDDIESCYFDGSISGSGIGGFASRGNGASRIRDCYCVAAIAGASKAGAFVRYLDWSVQVSDCFWDKTVFAEDRNIENVSEAQKAGITGLDTAALQSGQTLREAGWDFVGTWVSCEGDYPRLWWEEVECR